MALAPKKISEYVTAEEVLDPFETPVYVRGAAYGEGIHDGAVQIGPQIVADRLDEFFEAFALAYASSGGDLEEALTASGFTKGRITEIGGSTTATLSNQRPGGFYLMTGASSTIEIPLDSSDPFGTDYYVWAFGTEAFDIESVAGVSLNGEDEESVTIAAGSLVALRRTGEDVWEIVGLNYGLPVDDKPEPVPGDKIIGLDSQNGDVPVLFPAETFARADDLEALVAVLEDFLGEEG